MLGDKFPISDYYRDHIIDAETVTRSGGWWTAVLLISDPKTKKPFIALYRWQLTENGWKSRKRFTLRRSKEIETVLKLVHQYSERIDHATDETNPK